MTIQFFIYLQHLYTSTVQQIVDYQFQKSQVAYDTLNQSCDQLHHILKIGIQFYFLKNKIILFEKNPKKQTNKQKNSLVNIKLVL